MLVIIDMQPEFDAARDDSLAETIIQEIRQSISEGEYIMVVEYANHGPSRYDITDELNGYDNWDIVIKNGDDGSFYILNHLDRKRVKSHLVNFKVCGVNYSACVESTIDGLIESGINPMNIDVLEYACANSKHFPPYCFSSTAYNLLNRQANVVKV